MADSTTNAGSMGNQTADQACAGCMPTWPDISGIPTTPIATNTPPVAPLPGDDIAGIPTTPIATNTPPVAPLPGDWGFWPNFPFPVPTFPSSGLTSQVRFLNATTNGSTLEVFIDNRNVLSGSTFATVSVYITVTDGFHTITIRQTSGQTLFQQTQAFVAGERMTMVILDAANGVSLARVSDMGCTNIPSGYGCLRVANMSYNGSNYDVRTFNNQVAFSGVSFREVTSFKQTAAGNYSFFVTSSQISFTAIRELPILVLSAIIGSGCTSCTVNNPLLTFNVSVEAGKAYTSYIIGNPWSNMYRVFTLES